MAQQNQKNNPLSALETKIFDALTNYENETKLITELEQKLLQARETAELNLKNAESLKTKKTRILTASELLRELGSEAAIAIELAGIQPPPEGEPNTAPPATEQQQPEPVKIEPTKQPEPQPEPIAANLPGDTISEQIANVPPVEKKPEATEPQASEPSPDTLDVDGYSFQFFNLGKKEALKFEFFDKNEKHWHGAAMVDAKPSANIGLRPDNLAHLTYTTNSQDWPRAWDQHLFVIEKALQQILENPELTVTFPLRSQPAPAKPAVTYREDGFILLDWTKPEVKGTNKVNGYTVSFKEGKTFEIKAGRFHSVVLKIVGQGTTLHGLEAQAYFEQNASEFYLCVKDKDGKLYDDRKTKEMPKHLEEKRRAAINFVASNFPYVSSKFESEIVYTTPAPKTQPAGPQAAADNSNSEK